MPELYNHYAQRAAAVGWAVRESELNTYLCNDLLSWFPDQPEKAKAFFARYGMLKELRNRLAHMLCTVTEDDVKAACGISPSAILAEIEGTIIACYPACDPTVFNVYDNCIAYIKSRL